MTKLYIIILFIFVTACNYSIPKAQDTTSGSQTIEQLPSGTIPGYQVIATEIIAPKCLGCHSSGGGNAAGINLETYANVSGHLAAISSAVNSGSMPKNIAPLTAKEKEVFLAWIDAGGPLVSPTPATSPTDPTTSIPSTPPPPAPTPSYSPPPPLPPPLYPPPRYASGGGGHSGAGRRLRARERVRGETAENSHQRSHS